MEFDPDSSYGTFAYLYSYDIDHNSPSKIPSLTWSGTPGLPQVPGIKYAVIEKYGHVPSYFQKVHFVIILFLNLLQLSWKDEE